MTKEILLKELITKQRKNISMENKLQYSDLLRLLKYITSSIFDENHCSIWNGHIIERPPKDDKNEYNYINFYYRKKKVMLHRLLFINFVDNLETGEYVKFICENKGKCCNINHLKKIDNGKKTVIIHNLNHKPIEIETNEDNSKELIIDFE